MASAHERGAQPRADHWMRILLVTGSFPPMRCGVGDYTAHLCGALARIPALEVGVVTDVNARRSTRVDGVEVFPLIDGWSPKDLSAIRVAIRLWKPDIVHLQYPTRGYQGWLPWLLPILLPNSSCPIIQTWHEYFFSKGAAIRAILLALTAHDVVVVRPQFEQRIAPRFRLITRHIRFHHVPNASSIPRIEVTPTERRALRKKLTPHGETLLVYFGFLLQHKGADLLFELADPSRDRLVLVGGLDAKDSYHRSLVHRAKKSDWEGKVTFTGFLPASEAAKWMAISDAVVLPFRDGGGLWNSSIHGAVVQGTFVLTTSTHSRGYVEQENIYYSRVGDVEEMRHALRRYAGRSRSEDVNVSLPNWQTIAAAHAQLYSSVLANTQSFHG